MKKRNKNEVLEFIHSSVGPTGPWVLAGFGTEIEKQLANEPGSFEIVLHEWVNESDCTALAEVLEEIISTPLLDDKYEQVKSKFPEDWVYVTVMLLFTVCEKHETRYQEIQANLSGIESAKDVMSELQIWWNER